MSACVHPDETLFWVLGEKHEAACDEAGWFCGGCRTVLGFRPDLDRRLTVVKVFSLLQDLHDRGFVYVSNGTQGELVCDHVTWLCRGDDIYDQYTIIRLLLSNRNLAETHGAYWQTRSEEWLQEQATQGVGQ